MKYITTAIIVLVIVLAGSLVLLITNSNNTGDQNGGVPSSGEVTGSSDFFPTTTTTSDGLPQDGSSEGGVRVINVQNDRTLQVENFLGKSQTVKDTQNDGVYYLGNHFPIPGAEVSSNPSYVIMYITEGDFFSIGLYQKPIEQARSDAEAYLMRYLGIGKKEMCLLNYQVTVPYDVSHLYSGRSLGFSFCPGSISL